MKRLIINISLFLLITLFHLQADDNKNIRILSFNVWSGLDYDGIFNMGEYENENIRNTRLNGLIIEIKKLKPDLVFLQEVNDISATIKQLTDSTGYDEIHIRVNAGLKLFSLGFPNNLNEGLVILAKRGLNLELINAKKLYGSPGIFSDEFSLQFDEANFMLIGKIIVNNIPFIVVNTHLLSSPFPDSVSIRKTKEFAQKELIDSDYVNMAVSPVYSKSDRRLKEIKSILFYTEEFRKNFPIILGGDFNMIKYSYEYNFLTQKYFLDCNSKSNEDFTWDPVNNDNIGISSRIIAGLNKEEEVLAFFDSVSSFKQRTIDYIFISDMFNKNDIINSNIVMKDKFNGVNLSDHFGVMSEISLDNINKNVNKEFDYVTLSGESITNIFPILSYDTDVGFGFGIKAALRNYMKKNEMFDLTLFNSTKGERWYRFQYSIPEKEIRQKKEYDIAFDFVIDFDQYLKYNYFGTGNNTNIENREYYTRSPLDISFTFSRGFTPYFSINTGLRYLNINNFNFSDSGKLINVLPLSNRDNSKGLSAFVSIKYDTRNSNNHPTKGSIIQFDTEYYPEFGFTNLNFLKLGLWLNDYTTIFYPQTVFAWRFGIQKVIGDSLPVQLLLPIGGGKTLRGYYQDRFLGKISAICNAELRFPLTEFNFHTRVKIGGVFGVDAGNLWLDDNEVSFKNIKWNVVTGLRIYLDLFIVRIDAGFGKEGMGFYLNFDHMF